MDTELIKVLAGGGFWVVAAGAVAAYAAVKNGKLTKVIEEAKLEALRKAAENTEARSIRTEIEGLYNIAKTEIAGLKGELKDAHTERDAAIEDARKAERELDVRLGQCERRGSPCQQPIQVNAVLIETPQVKRAPQQQLEGKGETKYDDDN